jgi:hydrogenase nickel incorporation protein HypB
MAEAKNHQHDHHHHHHDHAHKDHDHHAHEQTRTIEIGLSILQKNEKLAQVNRAFFAEKNLLVMNVLSSPGSGKTTFIQKMLTDLKDIIKAGVIVGDLATDHDAQRLKATGSPAIQITTGTICHLEADLVAKAAQQLPLDELDLLIIENVGNLVCPASYDLGENYRLVLFSVTEGEDKPLKYPTMFKTADVVIITKIDIAEAVEFDEDQALTNIKKVAPQARIFQVSARRGQGLSLWYDFCQKEYLTQLKLNTCCQSQKH